VDPAVGHVPGQIGGEKLDVFLRRRHLKLQRSARLRPANEPAERQIERNDSVPIEEVALEVTTRGADGEPSEKRRLAKTGITPDEETLAGSEGTIH
jgi:hypothetical protein